MNSKCSLSQKICPKNKTRPVPWYISLTCIYIAELLGFRLKEKNLLNENVRIYYSNREKDLTKFFSDEISVHF